MRKVREVIVVEGRYDKNALKQIVEAVADKLIAENLKAFREFAK